MKLLSVFHILFFICFSATAQTTLQQFHKQYVASILRDQDVPSATWKTTGTKQRLIAASNYQGTQIRDTLFFKYSSERGSTFDLDAMQYQISYAGNIPSILCDTMTNWKTGVSNNVLGLYEGRYYTYGANSQIAEYRDYNYSNNTINSINKTLNSFDAQGKITVTYYLSWNGMQWDTISHSNLIYNTQGKVVDDSNYFAGSNLFLQYVIHNVYGSNGLLATSSMDMQATSWVHESDYLCTYYPNGKLKTSTIEYHSDPLTQQKDSFVYDAANQFVQFMTEYKFNGAWYEYSKREKHVNAAGLPDTLYSSWYNTTTHLSDTSIYESFSYNSFGNPKQSHLHNKVMAWDDRDKYYYYQQYTESVEQKSLPIDLNVYPNPTKDFITITSTQLINKHLHIQLYNSLGQLLENEQVIWSNNVHQLSLAGYNDGMYWVVIKDESGAVLCHKSIIKQ